MNNEMTPQKRVGLEPLLPLFQRLSEPQRIFLARYIANGYDSAEAARIAYPYAKNHAVMGCQLLQRRRIRKILDAHFQRNQTESVLLDVQRLIKRSQRKGANLDRLVPAWNRAAAALERLAAKTTEK